MVVMEDGGMPGSRISKCRPKAKGTFCGRSLIEAAKQPLPMIAMSWQVLALSGFMPVALELAKQSALKNCQEYSKRPTAGHCRPKVCAHVRVLTAP